MGASIRWEGLDEFKQALRDLPEDLTAEGGRYVEAAANDAAHEAKSGYPKGPTGNLISRVIVTHFERGKFSAGAIVKNTAPHAYLFEHGNQGKVRYYTGTDKRGRTYVNASRGPMPPGNVFIPAMMRARKRMYDRLIAMLERSGLKVTGDV
jgi:hypothetical protein